MKCFFNRDVSCSGPALSPGHIGVRGQRRWSEWAWVSDREWVVLVRGMCWVVMSELCDWKEYCECTMREWLDEWMGEWQNEWCEWKECKACVRNWWISCVFGGSTVSPCCVSGLWVKEWHREWKRVSGVSGKSAKHVLEIDEWAVSLEGVLWAHAVCEWVVGEGVM